MTKITFDPLILDPADYHYAAGIVGRDRLFRPDLEIAPDGSPYLYRWHVVPRNRQANVYLHVQVASDPERPLHDHPWDNQSVIISGGYQEIINTNPPWGRQTTVLRGPGDVIHRKAAEAHRLILPEGTKYTLSLFSTGPVVRDWGFWFANHRGRPDWASHGECIIETPDGRSIFKEPAL